MTYDEEKAREADLAKHEQFVRLLAAMGVTGIEYDHVLCDMRWRTSNGTLRVVHFMYHSLRTPPRWSVMYYGCVPMQGRDDTTRRVYRTDRRALAAVLRYARQRQEEVS